MSETFLNFFYIDAIILFTLREFEIEEILNGSIIVVSIPHSVQIN